MKSSWTKLGVISEADLALCNLYASIRTISARRNGQERPFSTGQVNHVSNDVIGFIAEHAFCKHVNVFHDLVFGGRDEGYDCLVDNKRIDVKAIRNINHNLLVKKYEHVYASVDVFVLVYVDAPDAWIVGWIDKESATNQKYFTTLPDDDCFLIPKDDLRHWAWFDFI
jgi:hypothetical protein